HCEVLGPLTAVSLAARTGLDAEDVDRGLRMLEAGGFILRGRFTQSPAQQAADAADEFCDRRLLARIHRYTLDRLQREIDPVTAPRITPITLALRSDLPLLLDAVRAAAHEPAAEPIAGAAAEVLDVLRARGALFFEEIAAGTRRLSTDVEQGLRELIAWGLVA